jgi:hypothetical protein
MFETGSILKVLVGPNTPIFYYRLNIIMQPGSDNSREDLVRLLISKELIALTLFFYVALLAFIVE